MTKPRHSIRKALPATALVLIVAAASHAASDPKPEIPMAVDLDRAATTRWLNKKVLASRLPDDMENPTTWTLQHRGQLSFTKERCHDGQQSVRITVPTLSDQPNKVHGRSFGEATLSRHFQNKDAPTTAQWTATVVNTKAPWVAVVVPDGNLGQRREVTAKINPP